MRWLLLAICGVAWSCGPPPLCEGEVTPVMNALTVAPLPGETVRYEVGFDAPSSCVPMFDSLDLEASATAPDGTVLPVTRETLERGASGGTQSIQAVFSFVAAAPGPHTLTVHATPVDFDFSDQLWAVTPRPEVRTQLAEFAEGECTRPLETTRGTLICDGRVLRDGVVVQTLPGFLGVGGDVVWSYVRGGEVTRWVDSGAGALSQDPPVGHAVVNELPAAPGYFEAATETEWVLATGEQVQRFRLNGTFLDEEPALMVFRDLSFGGLVRDGTHVVLQSTVGTDSKLCFVEAPADAALVLGGPCVSDGGLGFFSEPLGDRVWRCPLATSPTELGTLECRLEAPSGNGLATVARLATTFGQGFEFKPWLGYANPALSRGFIPRLDGTQTLQLDEAVLPDGWAFYGLTPTRIVAQHRTLRRIGLFTR